MENAKLIHEEEIDSRGLSHSLDLLKDTYNYNHWIYSHLRPWLGEQILEVGSGCGNITRFLLDSKEVTCLEPLKVYIPILNQLAETHQNVQVRNGLTRDLPQFAQTQVFDKAICINVLEHIEEDAEALRDRAAALQTHGLLLYVPSCQWAYGTLDAELKHFRRYGRRTLKALVEANGFQVERCYYVNFIGVFGWWWSGRVMKDVVIDHSKAQLVDRMVPYLSALENLMHPPVGQSLFLVARKAA